MQNGSGHEYDVFVSYAHADDGKPLGSAAEYGWVTTLARNLNTGPNHYRKKLFIDHQLKPGDPFSNDLVTKVTNSTLLLLLLSRTTSQALIRASMSDYFGQHVLREHEGGVSSAQFAPDGKTVVTASDDKTARLWSCQSCRPVEALAAQLEKTIGWDLTKEERRRFGVPDWVPATK